MSLYNITLTIIACLSVAPAFALDASRHIASITDSNGVARFGYDADGHLTTITTDRYGTNSSVRYVYTPGVYDGRAYDLCIVSANGCASVTYYVTIDAAGRAAECLVANGYDPTADHRVALTYNADGQLRQVDNIFTNYTERTTLEYDCGDIVGVTTVNEDTDGTMVLYDTAIQNSAVDNIGQVMIFAAYGTYDHMLPMLYYAGLLGNATRHLPEAVVDTDIFGTDTYRIGWLTDVDGYPSSMLDGKVGNDLSISWMTTADTDTRQADTDIADWYDLRGIRTGHPTTGINVVTTSNGTAHKVLVK